METYESPRGLHMPTLLVIPTSSSSLDAPASGGGGELTPGAPPTKSLLSF